ncbi:MAG: hypothetical protein ACRD44_09290 [Bryobacteraceae bacterium]
MDLDNVIASRIDTAWKTREVEFEVITPDHFRRERGIDDVALLKDAGFRIDSEVFDGRTGFVYASRKQRAPI